MVPKSAADTLTHGGRPWIPEVDVTPCWTHFRHAKNMGGNNVYIEQDIWRIVRRVLGLDVLEVDLAAKVLQIHDELVEVRSAFIFLSDQVMSL